MTQEEYNKLDIWEIRKSKKMSRKEFGAMLGVTARTVESWEQGLRNPSKSVLKLLSYLK